MCVQAGAAPVAKLPPKANQAVARRNTCSALIYMYTSNYGGYIHNQIRPRSTRGHDADAVLFDVMTCLPSAS